jgi:hypothetical protein
MDWRLRWFHWLGNYIFGGWWVECAICGRKFAAHEWALVSVNPSIEAIKKYKPSRLGDVCPDKSCINAARYLNNVPVKERDC